MISLNLTYNDDIHFNHKKPWKTSEIKYLKQSYGVISNIDISLALGRTYKTVCDKIYQLKKIGELNKKPNQKIGL